jgi:hypothetical protein
MATSGLLNGGSQHPIDLSEVTAAIRDAIFHPLYFVGPILFSSAWAKTYSSKFDSRVAKHLRK